MDEASYIIEKSRAVAALTASSADQLGSSLEQHIRVKQKQPSFRKISIAPCLRSWHYQPREIFTSSNWYQDDNNPAFVIFTSGTTGRPKGAIHRRGLIHEVARSIADHYKLTEDDLLLHLLPVHHGTGAYFSFFPFLICGACIEFRSGNFSAERTWDRWRKGGVTFFSGVPTMYVRMMRYFEAHIGNSKFAGTTAEYESAARSIRGMLCGGSTLPRPVQHFWETLRDGKRILDRYGSTESGLVFREALDCDQSPDGTVGLLSPGVEVKFAGGGDEGELLLRSPTMFMGYVDESHTKDYSSLISSRYLFDEEATKRAHDADGFYKTGDIVRREGDYYFILGRASVDILKSGGYKISALDIERECLGLDYINEVMVVGVDDTEWGQRVAAVVSLRDDQKVYSYRGLNDLKELTLDQLRHDLSDKLAKYKLPTLLRVIPSELPKTPTGKVSKKLLGPVLFPPHYTGVPDVQVYASSSGKDMAKKARL